MSEADAARRRALARHPDEETRYRAVAALDPADADERALLLERLADPSWRVRSGAVERLAGAPDPVPALAALLHALEAGPGVGARVAAARALSRIGAATVPPLVERLGAPDPDLRQAAAAVLGEIADPRAVPPLTARLADRDANVRSAAAEALGKIGGRDAADALRAAADSDDPTLRLAAVEGLVQLRAAVPPALLERLVDDPALRRPAYRLLGACDDPAAIPLLVRGLCEAARSAREAALAALGEQRTRRPAQALAPLLGGAAAAAVRDPGLVDAWAAALPSPDPLVAGGALAALAAAGAARHVGAMLRLAEDERLRAQVEDALEALPPGAELRAALADAVPVLGQGARLAALAALVRAGSAAAFERLVREASDPGAYAQPDAIAALGRLGDARGILPLAGLLADDAPAAAGLASTALVQLGRRDAGARAAVLSALRDRAGAGPSAALYRSLGAIGDRADLDLLRAGLAGPSATQRAGAAAAIGALAGRGLVAPGDVPELGAAAGDPAWQVRAAAALALAAACAASGDEAARREARATLGGALRDAEPMVGAAAARALAACGDAEDAAPLAEVAGDATAAAPLVVAALQALVALGPVPEAVVLRAIAHPDPEVVKEGVLAAARLPAPQGVRILREAATSPRWDVRQAAARAMRARGDAGLADEAARLAAAESDPLVAQAFADAARSLGAP